MTTIFKVSDHERITPTMEKVEQTMRTPQVGEGRKFAATLDENGLAEECERIEKCASAGQDYAYFSEWPKDQVDQLREYAAVVGLKGKMIAVRQAEVASAPVVEDDEEMKRLAAIQPAQPKVSADLAIAVGDPFHLTDLPDGQKAKDDWERVAPERKLASCPNADRAGSIMPIRGEYDYETSQALRVRPGENSVADPDAIGKLAKTVDTGERLKAEAIQHAAERKAAKTSWQQEVVAAAKAMGPGALSRGTVILAADAAPVQKASEVDLKTAVAEIGNRMDGELPDLTDGEKLKETNAARKAGIQREAVSDDWQRVKGSTRPSLQDAFADALELQLQRVAKVASTKQPVKTAAAQPVQPTAAAQPVEKLVVSGTAQQSDDFAAALEAGLGRMKK